MNPLSFPNDSNPRAYFKHNFSSLLDSLDGPNGSDQHPNDTHLPSYPSRSKRKSPTIEFRQQCGTLDPDVMVHWIRFLGALVDFAGAVSLESLVDFLGIEMGGYGQGYRVIRTRPISASFLNESQRITPSPTASPRTRPVSSLSSQQSIGSLRRLFSAMESVDIFLDPETYGFWRRKFPA